MRHSLEAGTELVHGFTFFRSLGGVQTVLRQHWAEDERWGFRSRMLAYFEPDQPPWERVESFGLTWRDTIKQARQRFRRAMPMGGAVLAYHNCWGVPFFSELDGATRRIGVLHSDWPGLARHLEGLRGFLDGVLCVSHPLLKLVRTHLPEFDEARAAFLPYPVAGNGQVAPRAPLSGRPLVLGFCGRLLREQKRVDRLPGLFHALKTAGVDVRLELLGEGLEGAWLRERLAGEAGVVFHGRLSGEAYWQTLNRWDAIIFVSDYEGLPIALLEAMSVGVAPVYPRIGCGGEQYILEADPSLLYGSGDIAEAVRLVQRLRQLPEDQWAALRARCAASVRAHLGDNYLATFAKFTRQVLEWPRRSGARFAPRSFYFSDHCPFGILRRVYPRGLWQGNRLYVSPPN